MEAFSGRFVGGKDYQLILFASKENEDLRVTSDEVRRIKKENVITLQIVTPSLSIAIASNEYRSGLSSHSFLE